MTSSTDALVGCCAVISLLLVTTIYQVFMQTSGKRIQDKLAAKSKTLRKVNQIFGSIFNYVVGFIKLFFTLFICMVVSDYVVSTFGNGSAFKLFIGFVYVILVLTCMVDIFGDFLFREFVDKYKNRYIIIKESIIFIWTAVFPLSIIFMLPVIISTFWK